MCGIFGYISNDNITESLKKRLEIEADMIQHRGPDDRQIYSEKNVLLAFYRLAINDLSANGNQPLRLPDSNLVLICNGEIYNWKKLQKEYNYKLSSSSDCEIILHLYKEHGFEKTINMLDGVFSCILCDWEKENPTVFVARDPIGVRPLFMGFTDEDVMFCSEMKSLHGLANTIKQFPPGTIWNNQDNQFIKYYDPEIIYKYNFFENYEQNEIESYIKLLFIDAVDKRLMSERPIGCLLSGGLDSSLVAALLAKKIKNLRTFSIGLKGATDLAYAKKVADFIGAEHTEIIVSEEEMFQAIEPTIRQIESYDTTTVRASTPMYLLSKYIKENTDITVIYSGEGSDEASGSYLYFRNAPDKESFHNETVRLMSDLSYFDVLRCDRTTAGHSLEVRVPFLDKRFLKYYMTLDPNFKIPSSYQGCEKYTLRKAFSYDKLLPDDILWRTKEAFSDGVSSTEKSWYTIINEKVESLYSTEEIEVLRKRYDLPEHTLSETVYFRHIFEKHYHGRASIIPYYWLPKWSNETINPSARVLDV